MNVVIDIGNSNSKIFVFDKGRISFRLQAEKLTPALVKKVIKSYPVSRAILSSVKAVPDFLSATIGLEGISLHILTFKSKLPFKIRYSTPETLGSDRIAAVAGAFSSFGDSDMLVIDAGTAITYDLFAGMKFTGGTISPGIDTRFRALNTFTGKLPLLRKTWKYTFPGRNTNDAITAGVMTGVVYEINEYIRTFSERHSNLKVIITGGDAGFLKSRISQRCIYMPDIVAEGLNFILEYNA